MFLSNVLDAEIVHDEGEGDGSGVVQPQISKLFEMGGEAVIGDAPCLLQARHAFPDFHVNPAVWSGDVMEVVFLNEFTGNLGDMDLHVFIPSHGSPVVKILDVEGTKPCIGCGNGAVEKDFGGGQPCCIGGSGAGEIETVTTSAISDAMNFRLGWANGCLLLHVCDLSTIWNLIFSDEENGVSASYALVWRSFLSNSLS